MAFLAVHNPTHPFHTQTGRVYSGRFTYLKYALKDHMIIIFHKNIAIEQPVSLYWQWTITAANEEKYNTVQNCLISGIERTSKGYKLKINRIDGYYSYTAEMDERALYLTVHAPGAMDVGPQKIELVWPPADPGRDLIYKD